MEGISQFEMRDQLRRILDNKRFAKARKKSRFLEFVCEQALLGNGEQLNEYLIATEIYGRGVDFDPDSDAIVRVQAFEIRKSLREYYGEEGQADPWRIELPVGHYSPTFKRGWDGSKPAAAATAPDPGRVPSPAAAAARSPVAPVTILILAAGCAAFALLWLRQRNEATLSTPPRLPEEVIWFWKPFLPPAADPLVAIPTHPVLRAAHEGDSEATLRGSHLIPKDALPEFRDTIHFRELEGFHFVPSTTDFTSIGEVQGLVSLLDLFQRTGQKLQVKPARLIDFDTVKHSNAILLGGNQAWSGRIFLYTEGFWFHKGVIWNKKPLPGEQTVYKPQFDPITNALTRDYALLLMLPNENRSQRILLLYGIYTQGSQAAIEYVSNAEHLRDLRNALAALTPTRQPPEFFQVLLTTTVENSVPGKASFVSARMITP